MTLIYWSVRSSSWRKVDVVMGLDGGIVILASCENYFNGVHENLVQHPSNYTSNASIPNSAECNQKLIIAFYDLLIRV